VDEEFTLPVHIKEDAVPVPVPVRIADLLNKIAETREIQEDKELDYLIPLQK